MFINVSQRRQWVEISGSGSPAILLESGCGGGAADWSLLGQALAEQTTVITYDRAGNGRSEPSRGPRLASTMAGELHDLLDTLEIARPIFLIGLSLGALIVREFARMHRHEVCALLLLEPAHEALELAMPADYWEVEQNEMRAAATASRAHRPGFAAEIDALDETTKAMRSVPDHSLGSIPLTVVTAKKKWGDIRPPIDPAAVDAAWVALHQRTVALSTAGRGVDAWESGHNVHREAPALVIEEALSMLEGCRRASR